LPKRSEITGHVQKAYKTATKGFKEQVQKRIQDKTLNDKAGPSILDAIRDELPAKETFHVTIP
jgi:hypothetical protein